LIDELLAALDRGNDCALNDRFEERFFAVEVEIERALRNAGASGDVFKSGRGEALLDEQIECRGGKLAWAGVFAAPPAGFALGRLNGIHPCAH
jgi:hypothetical protein